MGADNFSLSGFPSGYVSSKTSRPLVPGPHLLQGGDGGWQSLFLVQGVVTPSQSTVAPPYSWALL